MRTGRMTVSAIIISNMNITITVDGITREFAGEYHELHARDWNERVRDLLDCANERSDEDEPGLRERVDDLNI